MSGRMIEIDGQYGGVFVVFYDIQNNTNVWVMNSFTGTVTR